MLKIFNALYKINKDAILSIFPCLSRAAMHQRARAYCLVGTWRPWSPVEVSVLREFWPDRAAIQSNLPTQRTRRSIDTQAGSLGLTKKLPERLKWTAEEDAQLKSGIYPEGRTYKSCEHRLSALGVRARDIKSARKMTGSELQDIIRQAVPRHLPRHIREDAEADLLLTVMDGKIAPTRDAISTAAKKAVTAVYKMHPDRGAPTSLDATLFDDSTTTVGDRISSETFHF